MKNALLAIVGVALLGAPLTHAAPAKAKKKAASQTTSSPSAPVAEPEIYSPPPAPEPVVQAPAPAPVAEAAPAAPEKKSKVKLSYTVITAGSRLDAWDGYNGSGTDFYLRHIPSIGYRFTPNFSLNLGQEIHTIIGRDKPDGLGGYVNRDRFVSNGTQPYVTGSFGSIYSHAATNFNVPMAIRYYISSTIATIHSEGTQNDQANGLLRFEPVPTWTVDKVEFSCLTRLQFFIPGKWDDYATVGTTAGKPRRDSYFMFIPQIAYNLTDKVQPYIYYQVGRFYHSRDGKFTNMNLPDLGKDIEIGFNYSASPKLSLNPFIDFGANSDEDLSDPSNTRIFTLKRASIGLLASYVFL